MWSAKYLPRMNPWLDAFTLYNLIFDYKLQ